MADWVVVLRSSGPVERVAVADGPATIGIGALDRRQPWSPHSAPSSVARCGWLTRRARRDASIPRASCSLRRCRHPSRQPSRPGTAHSTSRGTNWPRQPNLHFAGAGLPSAGQTRIAGGNRGHALPLGAAGCRPLGRRRAGQVAGAPTKTPRTVKRVADHKRDPRITPRRGGASFVRGLRSIVAT